jgi:hypothetical protein
VPDPPEVIVIHVGLATAVHGHPAPAVTAIGVPVPPAAGIDCVVGARL